MEILERETLQSYKEIQEKELEMEILERESERL